MPTQLRVQGPSYFTDEMIGVLAVAEGMRSPRMITADLTYFKANSKGNIIIPPGYFWQKILTGASAGLGRLLPMIKAVAATPTTSNKLTVRCAQVFKPGDAIGRSAGGVFTAIGTVSSIDADKNEITLQANAAVAVAIGDVLIQSGLVYNDGSLLGMNVGPVELSEINDVACYTSCSVYAARLPQWDNTIKAAFPEITLVPN